MLKLLTDKSNRRATLGLLTSKLFWVKILKYLKVKLMYLPGVHYIVVRYMAYKEFKENMKLDNWERYVRRKEKTQKAEKKLAQECFCKKLSLLELIILSESVDEMEFNERKSEVLSDEMINAPELKEFKEWLENYSADNIDYTDYSKIEGVLDLLEKQINFTE